DLVAAAALLNGSDGRRASRQWPAEIGIRWSRASISSQRRLVGGRELRLAADRGWLVAAELRSAASGDGDLGVARRWRSFHERRLFDFWDCDLAGLEPAEKFLAWALATAPSITDCLTQFINSRKGEELCLLLGDMIHTRSLLESGLVDRWGTKGYLSMKTLLRLLFVTMQLTMYHGFLPVEALISEWRSGDLVGRRQGRSEDFLKLGRFAVEDDDGYDG
ncbi:unnamed protein product, partial [Linum tenue]